MNMPKTDAHSEANAKLMQVALNRSDLYQLLAISFRDPTAELVEGLISGTFCADAEDCIRWLNVDSKYFDEPLTGLKNVAVKNAERDSNEILRDMKVEYARLFIGPGEVAVSPFQTVHVDDRDGQGQILLFNSRTARAVEKAYNDVGVSLVSKNQEPPDHIATELEFLMYLCAQEGQAWQNRNNEEAKMWRRSERKFIDAHLAKWAFKFFEEVMESTKIEEYRFFALLGKKFLELEAGHKYVKL